ncbi:hypothetical protein VdG1_02670 [Verticillium dahliae VDG1]|nr:Sterol regulatory element-binding protein cleavage-activating protein [Verticillium dahliae VDG2]KAF3359108.1 hypothetical protein VdG1_02670 [Verticillium dahliae VDG1]
MADLKTNDTLSLELGRNASFHKTDVADYESQAKTFQEVRNEHGRIDALLANAGIVDKESLYIFDHRDSDVIPPKPSLLWTDIDWKGVVYGTQLATHFMRKNKVSASSWRREAWRHYTHTRRIQKMAASTFGLPKADAVRQKENIRINVVLPGIVATSIIPPGMVAAVSPECMTPFSSIVAAYNMFLEDDTLSGQAIECSAGKRLFVPTTEPLNGHVSKRAVTVWQPLFKMYHHEGSGLPDAIE